MRIKRLVGHALGSIQREFILQTLAECHGNRTRSAEMLGISIRSLRDRIYRYRNEGDAVPTPQPIFRERLAPLPTPDLVSNLNSGSATSTDATSTSRTDIASSTPPVENNPTTTSTTTAQ